MKVNIKEKAPTLWGLINPDLQSEIDVLSTRSASTQEFAPAGFPEGTGHGLGHIESVFSTTENMLKNQSNIEIEYNPTEAYLMSSAIITHDLALVKGRQGHSEYDRIKEIIDKLKLPITGHAKDAVIAVASAHSGKNQIESLPPKPVPLLSGLPAANLRKVAATVRLADEISEDYSRTSPAIFKGKLLPKPSIQYHKFADKAFTYIDSSTHSIVVDIAASDDELRELHGKGLDESTLISNFLDRCIKIESERLYCARFLSRSIVPKSTRLLVRETRAKAPWCEIYVTADSSELRATLYDIRPTLLIPKTLNTDNNRAEKILNHSLRECYADSMRCLIKFGSAARNESTTDYDFMAILEDSFTYAPSHLVKFILDYIMELYKIPFSLDIVTFSEYLERFSIGDPLMISVSYDGSCLFDSSAFKAIKLLVNQKLKFSRSGLISILLKSANDEFDLLKKPRIRFNQIQSVYRGVLNIAQSYLLFKQKNDQITLNFIYKLSKVSHIKQKLIGDGVPKEILESYGLIVNEFKSLDPRNKDLAMYKLSDEYNNIIDDWISLAMEITEQKYV